MWVVNVFSSVEIRVPLCKHQLGVLIGNYRWENSGNKTPGGVHCSRNNEVFEYNMPQERSKQNPQDTRGPCTRSVFQNLVLLMGMQALAWYLPFKEDVTFVLRVSPRFCSKSVI